MMNFEIPPGLTDLLQDFTVAVLKERPTDLEQFAADYFVKLNEKKIQTVKENEKQKGGGGVRFCSPPPVEPMQMDDDEDDDDDEPMPGECKMGRSPDPHVAMFKGMYSANVDIVYYNLHCSFIINEVLNICNFKYNVLYITLICAVQILLHNISPKGLHYYGGDLKV